MKRILLSFLLLIVSFRIFPQVTTVPEFPTQNDSIIVYLDTSQPGAEELLNYTGTVYAHTGVNTNLGDWQHVIGSWGNNSTQPALIRLGTNIYKLVIGNPKEFYNDTTNEEISALAFVFRTADGSKQTRPDIFINIYEPGLTVKVDQPIVSVDYLDPLRSPAFVNKDDSLQIKISSVEIGTKISSISLFVNNVLAAQTDSNQLGFNFISNNYSVGANNVKVIGVDTSGIADSSLFVLFVNPAVESISSPAGIQYGINYINGSTVTLSLFAPAKEFVYVLGDFNDWKVDTAYYMKRDEINVNSVVWWLTINGLNPGEEYAFQYLVDGIIRIGDPYSEKVLDPWNDQYITGDTYPNLKEYPEGKTSEPASVLQTDQIPYEWNTTGFERPAKTDLVIYELLIRDFVSTHNYQTLIDTLGYLKNLGINAIELMPVMEFEGNESWGYNPSFHLAADKYYGPKNDLKRFIDSCHSNGIAVILDMVLNHAYGQSPLVRLYWDSGNNRPAANNPWFNVVSPNPVFSFGYDFNHEKQATKDFVDRVNRFWLQEYKFDGFRFDFTKGFTNTPGDGGSFDQSRINILKRMADSIWAYDSSAYIILEHFAPNNEEKILSDYGMMLWGNINYNYNEATMGWLTNSDFSWVSYKARGWNNPDLVSYMESHDEERLMYKNLQFGNSSGDYNIKDLGTALIRIKLAAAFFFTIPGPKMIWQFGELGYDVSIDNPCRVCNKPIKWEYFNQPARENLYKVFSALINLKKDYDAFRSTSFTTSLSGAGKRISITDLSMNVTIIGNFNVQPININPAFQNTGTWYDYFNGDSINVSDTQALIPLEPGEFHIYTTVKLPPPEQGILSEIKTSSQELIKEYSLGQNYPNPFNPSTEITFQIVKPSNVNLKIFDILGREVKTLINEEKGNGRYSIRWNGDNNFNEPVSSGIYFYKLDAGSFTNTKKMMLLR
ncbi:MAG: alpha-amylase family glycosyl hydrolase [Ignavibacteria bacterium]